MVRVTAIIAAHNEAEGIAATIASLQTQTFRLAGILVMSDNSTDDTVGISRRAGAAVVETIDNKDRKAGALNQGLHLLAPNLGPDDFILQTDGDSVLEPDFVEIALRPHLANRKVGAVSCAYQARVVPGVLPALQRAEFAMERCRIMRRRGVPGCLSGVATIFRWEALQEVAASRGRVLPGEAGYYLSSSLTEDFELTLAMTTLGWQLRSPDGAVAWTDVMRTVPALWRQRLRWQRGTLETLRLYGLRRNTCRAYVEQAGAYAMTAFAPLVLLLWGTALATHGLSCNPWWFLILPVVAVSQALEVRSLRSWRTALLVAVILPMWVYGLWRSAVYWSAALQAVRKTSARWA